MTALTQDGPGSANRTNSFVLVVDSDAQNLVFLSMVLQRITYPVCTASAAGPALEMAEAAAPALIITELNLRGMSGMELMQRIRKEPRTHAVPLVVMTADLTPEVEKQCSEAGAVACLAKPVQSDDLYRVISPIMEPRSRRTDVRIPTRLPVVVNDRPLDCVEDECATNLSTKGIHIRTMKSYPVNSQVLLQMTLHGQAVTAEARVVYCRPSGAESSLQSVGLQFLTISPQGGEVIRRFINDEAAHGLAPGWV